MCRIVGATEIATRPQLRIHRYIKDCNATNTKNNLKP